MSADEHTAVPRDRVGAMMGTVQIPLENMEYMIERYLLENGTRLDPDTRWLLAGLRDGIGQVAVSTRRLADESARVSSGV